MSRGLRTPWPQAILLAGLGTLAGLAALELGLRAAGALLSLRARTLGRDVAGTAVLCLGESTTAPTIPSDHSWPAQLAAKLDAAGAGRFTVVNEGLTGARSDELLALVPRFLDEHRPAVVVGMFGVNDAQWYGRPEASAPAAPPALRSLRLYKLARYVLEEVVRRTEPRTGEEGVAQQRAIARAIVKRGVPLILMQYPGLDAADLEARFAAFGDRVSFVDNKTSFDRALAAGKYEDYFTDRFAGEWGHCTAAGDALLAENAARAVLALGLRGGAATAPTYIARGRARTDFRQAPLLFSRERERQLADFRAHPTLDHLARLLALLRDAPGARLSPADRALAREALARESGPRAPAEALSRAADLYDELGNRKAALEALARLTALRPGDPDAALRRASLAARLGDKKTALDSFAAAARLSNDAPRLRRAALGYQDLGRYAETVAIFERLARDDERSAQLQTDLGVCWSLAGEPVKAEAAFERAIALDPNYRPARESLASLRVARSRRSAARP